VEGNVYLKSGRTTGAKYQKVVDDYEPVLPSDSEQEIQETPAPQPKGN
jgi:hypothetical protein